MFFCVSTIWIFNQTAASSWRNFEAINKKIVKKLFHKSILFNTFLYFLATVFWTIITNQNWKFLIVFFSLVKLKILSHKSIIYLIFLCRMLAFCIFGWLFFIKEPDSYLRKKSKVWRNREKSERFGRRALWCLKPAPLIYQFWEQKLAATGWLYISCNFRAWI